MFSQNIPPKVNMLFRRDVNTLEDVANPNGKPSTDKVLVCQYKCKNDDDA